MNATDKAIEALVSNIMSRLCVIEKEEGPKAVFAFDHPSMEYILSTYKREILDTPCDCGFRDKACMECRQP